MWMLLLTYLYFILQVETCPKICRCANTSVYCFYKGITTNELVSIVPHIPNYVTKLYLSGNSIDILPLEKLSHLKHLRYLSLNFNKLSKLPTNISTYLPLLQELYLTANDIQELTTLTGYENIEMLNLNQNKIKQIPDFIFSHMKNLKELLLGQNQIEKIDLNTFYGLTNLQKLQLNNNKIVYAHELAFDHIKQIKEIYLHVNALTTVSDKLLSNLVQLETLYLTNNNIIEIGEKAFVNLKHLQVLYLDNNKLTKLPIFSFEQTAVSPKIYMNNNEFQCDCQLVMSLKVESHFKRLFDNKKITLGECIDPQTRLERFILSLDLNDLNCSACSLGPCMNGFDCLSTSTNPLLYQCLPVATTLKTTTRQYIETTSENPIGSIVKKPTHTVDNSSEVTFSVIISVCVFIVCVIVTLVSWLIYQRKKKKEFVVTSSSRRLTYDKVRHSQDTLLDGTMKSNVSSTDSTFNFDEVAHV